jgi:hypothetical protein
VSCTVYKGGVGVVYSVQGWGWCCVQCTRVGLVLCTVYKGGVGVVYSVQGWGWCRVQCTRVGLVLCTVYKGGVGVVYSVQGWGWCCVVYRLASRSIDLSVIVIGHLRPGSTLPSSLACQPPFAQPIRFIISRETTHKLLVLESSKVQYTHASHLILIRSRALHCYVFRNAGYYTYTTSCSS